MTSLLVIAIIIGLVLLFTGVFVTAVKWLLWVGIVLVVIAVLAWLMRMISGRKTSV